MALWAFQMLFNFIMAGFAVAWLLARRQRRSREQIAPRDRPTAAELTGLPVAPEHTAAINTPLGSPTSTLSERQAPEHRTSATTTVDSYDKADFLISRGMDLREVARQTGLSMAELQLIGKMSQKSQ